MCPEYGANCGQDTQRALACHGSDISVSNDFRRRLLCAVDHPGQPCRSYHGTAIDTGRDPIACQLMVVPRQLQPNSNPIVMDWERFGVSPQRECIVFGARPGCHCGDLMKWQEKLLEIPSGFDLLGRNRALCCRRMSHESGNLAEVEKRCERGDIDSSGTIAPNGGL